MGDDKSFKGRSEMHHAHVCTLTAKQGFWDKTAKLVTEQVKLTFIQNTPPNNSRTRIFLKCTSTGLQDTPYVRPHNMS